MRVPFVSLLCVLVGAAGGCDEPSAPPVAASIQIDASSDTLTLATVMASAPIQLTAWALSADGDVVERGEVTWSSPQSTVTIETTGARTATLSWNASSSEPVEIVAMLDGVSGRKTMPVCLASVMTATNSGTLLAGRSTTLSSTLYGVLGSGLSSPSVLDVPVTWRSSRPDIIKVDGPTASALSAGEATLSVSACDRSDSVEVLVTTGTYAITPVEVDGLTTTGTNLNDQGHVVGRAGPAGSETNFVWRVSGVTDLASCWPTDINGSGQILCRAPGPVIWEAGAASARDTMHWYGNAMNDSGHVVGYDQVWRGPGTSLPLASTLYVLALSDISNGGHVAGVGGAGYPHPFVWRDGQAVGLALEGRQGSVAAVNDSGDAVGSTENLTSYGRQSIGMLWLDSDGGSATFLRPSSGTLKNAVATGASDINNSRTVVGNGSEGPFLWRDGRLTLLNEVLADRDWVLTSVLRINNSGRILGQAVQTSTGNARAVLLDPPGHNHGQLTRAEP